MDTLGKYSGRDYIVMFLMTLSIFTFVMCIAAVVKAIDLLSRGVSAVLILEFFMQNIPYILTFSIPISALTTVLLMFSRLSLDGEITAMKASGIPLWHIIAAPLILSLVLSLVCLYLQSIIAPKAHYALRHILRNAGAEEPVNLLEEGRFVRDFPGIMIYVGKKDKREVEDIVVYELDERGVKQNVRAKSGKISSDREKRLLLIDLYGVRIDVPDQDHPMDLTKARHVTAQHYPVKLDFSRVWDNEEVQKKIADMTMAELIAHVRNIREAYPDLQKQDMLRHRMKIMVEINERLALALSCFAFTLLGIPLGIRSRRRESSIGIAISLVLVFLFYLFIIIADSLVGHPRLRPDLIAWVPVIAAQIAGFLMIRRAN